MKINLIESFDVGNYRIWKYDVDRLNPDPPKRRRFIYKVGEKFVKEATYEPPTSFKSKKKALEFIKERESKYVVSYVPKRGNAVIIRAFGTRKAAEETVQLLASVAEIEKRDSYYRINYSDNLHCSHFVDNQGLCHCCGITMCEFTAKESGFYHPEP